MSAMFDLQDTWVEIEGSRWTMQLTHYRSAKSYPYVSSGGWYLGIGSVFRIVTLRVEINYTYSYIHVVIAYRDPPGLE